MDYRDFSVEDLVLDPFFRSWVKYETPAAREFWEAWIAANPGSAARVEEARELVQYLDFKAEEPTAEDIGEVKDSLRRKFAKLKSTSRISQNAITGPYQMAAAIAFLLLASLAAIYFLPSSKLNISTTFGETRKLTFPDGSTVVLNANSSISYARNWEGENGREVWLEGEAYFEISRAPDRRRPEFYVYARQLTIKVLGTAFNVYKRGDKTQVVLKEGSVELSPAGGTGSSGKLLMKPGDKAELKDGNLEIEQVSVAPFLSWKDNRMVFENTPLSDIARLLEDNYGYEVIFKDSLLRKGPPLRELRFTGSYSAKRVDIFLTALEEAFDIEIAVDDKTITIQ